LLWSLTTNLVVAVRDFSLHGSTLALEQLTFLLESESLSLPLHIPLQFSPLTLEPHPLTLP
jgi:hypothetical protein